VIPAQKSARFGRWFARHAADRLRRTFHDVRVRGLASLRDELGRAPVLVVSNHTAWWDPLVSLVICERLLGADAYALMDAKSLRALPFFGRVGAFGVDLDDPGDGARAIRYAAKRLEGPGSLVWIFPQGQEFAVTARPLVFRPGSAEIARIAKRAVVVPVALRYEHGRAPEPSVWVSIGGPLEPVAGVPSGIDARRDAQARAVTAELDRIDRALVGGADEGFEPVLRKTPSRLGNLAQTMLAWATRPRRLR
jgi:1-acyl-sn-glycerol-3-phosphate acyltransferase